jgi:hypothetical protein
MCCLYSEKDLSDGIDFYVRFFKKIKKCFFKLFQETHPEQA